MKTHPLRLKNINDALTFATGGNATFTLKSIASSKRYTFRIRKADFRKKKSEQDQNAPLFVQYLNGPDNTSSYAFLGTIFNKKNYRFSPKSKAGIDSTVNKTIIWLFNTLISGNESNFEKVEFWHEGKCGVCGRKLTDPVSLIKGTGPTCVSVSAEDRKIRMREAKLAGLLDI